MEHVREVRSPLLVKLALLDRAGADPSALLRRQEAVLEPIASAIASKRPRRKGSAATLLAWRQATMAATMAFPDNVTAPG